MDLPAPHPLFPWLTPEVRAWLYPVAGAVGVLLVATAKIGPDDLEPWLELIGAILGIGGSTVAALHTPRS